MNVRTNAINSAHLKRYGEIYATAFAGEPWKSPWRVEDAVTHVREIMEQKTAYGLEYEVDGEVAGFILGTSMVFHYGRVFEIHDLAVHPDYQHRGVGAALLERCTTDVKARGMVSISLITAGKGFLPKFYERHGFEKENKVILMGKDI